MDSAGCSTTHAPLMASTRYNSKASLGKWRQKSGDLKAWMTGLHPYMTNISPCIFCFTSLVFFEGGTYFNSDQKPSSHDIGCFHICSVFPTTWVAHMSARGCHIDDNPGGTYYCTKRGELAMLCVQDGHQCQPEWTCIAPTCMQACACIHEWVHACIEWNSLRHFYHRCFLYHPCSCLQKVYVYQSNMILFNLSDVQVRETRILMG